MRFGVMLSPGWSRVRGAHEGTYREVWCELYELRVGEETTSGHLAEKMRVRPNRQSVHRAFAAAAKAGLIAKIQAGGRWFVWRRLAWPDVMTVEGLIQRGMPTWCAWNFLRALETGGYLRHVPGEGYRKEE
jgi:hypothetical protein